MSTTMTLSMAQLPETQGSACPNCGEALPHATTLPSVAAQKQIEDLEAQVRLLNQKAAAAGERNQPYPIHASLTEPKWTSGQITKTRSSAFDSSKRATVLLGNKLKTSVPQAQVGSHTCLYRIAFPLS